ncbi:4Fe-4S dicluster domain-containing protein [bacterium]|nr:4Fe-4S dicluster domain-containing protein [bacterium]
MSALNWQKIDTGFARELDPTGQLRILSCYQCKKCSSGCPMERDSDLHPHQIIRMVQIGRKEETLRSKGIWTCVSCQTCVTRCPMDVNTPAVIDALRAMASRAEIPKSVRQVSLFNRIFLEWAKRLGRIYELGMMGTFKAGSLNLFSDMEKFPMMLRKGKLRILPHLSRRRSNLRRVFKRTIKKGPK